MAIVVSLVLPPENASGVMPPADYAPLVSSARAEAAVSYYPTITEDIARAKQILAKGRNELVPGLAEAERELDPRVDVEHLRTLAGGTIFGADIYPAYKLLESLVTEVERLRASVVQAELQAEALTLLNRVANERIAELESAAGAGLHEERRQKGKP